MGSTQPLECHFEAYVRFLTGFSSLAGSQDRLGVLEGRIIRTCALGRAMCCTRRRCSGLQELGVFSLLARLEDHQAQHDQCDDEDDDQFVEFGLGNGPSRAADGKRGWMRQRLEHDAVSLCQA